MPESKRFLLRLDPRLFEALRRWADDELRSINAQIEYLLTDQARRAGRLPSKTVPRPSANTSVDGDIAADDDAPTDELSDPETSPARARGVTAPGQLDVLETAWNNNVAHAAILLQPAARRFVFTRAHKRARRAETLHFRVRPNARGRLLVRHHRYGVTLRLWVTYTPAGETDRKQGFYAAALAQAAQSCERGSRQ